jgi:hypothetical protein
MPVVVHSVFVRGKAGPTLHAHAHPFVHRAAGLGRTGSTPAQRQQRRQRDGGTPVRGPAGPRWRRRRGGGGPRGGVRHGPRPRHPPPSDLLPHLRPARPPEGPTPIPPS